MRVIDRSRDFIDNHFNAQTLKGPATMPSPRAESPRTIIASILALTRPDVNCIAQLQQYVTMVHGDPDDILVQWYKKLIGTLSAEEITELYESGHREAAEDAIVHVMGNSKLSDKPFTRPWQYLLDTAVKHHTSNRLLMRMLQWGCTGDRPLNAASGVGRMDTVKALFHNDWYGECWVQHQVMVDAIRLDDVSTVKWIWRYARTFTEERRLGGGGDLVNWFQYAIEYDAVNVFAYLHDYRLKACSQQMAEEVLEYGAIQILQWMLERPCTALHMSSIKVANPELKRYLRRHKGTLRQNQQTNMCEHRFYVVHYDHYTFGVRSDQDIWGLRGTESPE